MAFQIALQGITFGYEGSAPLLQGITTTIRGDEVTCLVAPVGQGKSTFLKLCAGLLRPTLGSLMIDGRDFWEQSDREQHVLRRNWGFDFQEGALIANMTIFQNLTLPLLYHGKGSREKVCERVERWLARLGLLHSRDLLPAALSTGLKRRVSYIRAMLTGGSFFFWDEPTESADDDYVELLVSTLAEKREQGIGSLVSTQQAPFLKRIADRVIVLQEGIMHYDGPLKEGAIPVARSMKGMLRGEELYRSS